MAKKEYPIELWYCISHRQPFRAAILDGCPLDPSKQKPHLERCYIDGPFKTDRALQRWLCKRESEEILFDIEDAEARAEAGLKPKRARNTI